MWFFAVVIGFFLSFESAAQASGPVEIAKAKASLWPDSISDRASFNAASRAEILLFLNEFPEQAVEAPKAESLGIKKINLASYQAWKKRASQYWQKTFGDASKDCQNGALGCGFKGQSFPELLTYAGDFTKNLPARYTAWKEMTLAFDSSYLKEQLRLAALFPNPTSEILPLGESEIFGDKFKDGEFLLSFDDGPTAAGGYTEKYAELLRKEKISALFFSLGNALQARLAKSSAQSIQHLYENQCLGSHGFEHKSHQKWADWKTSLAQTRAQIRTVISGGGVPFRPPYGQRNENVLQDQAQNLAPIILWNIDSQDWQNQIDADQVGDRVQKLMLLWRRGIILFHDIHPKALTALPNLIPFAKSSSLRWIDCHEVK